MKTTHLADPFPMPTQGPGAIQLALQGFDNRAAIKASHPVITKNFAFPTPPLVRAMKVILHIIGTGAPGGSFVSHSRFGKTSAIDYCCARLPEVFPDKPIFSFDAHHETRPTSRIFFSNLLAQTGFECLRASRKDPREQLVRAWWMVAKACRASSIILIGDEMQRLGIDEYTWLIDLTNDLKRLGVRTTAIFFGQPDFLARRSLFETAKRADILGRFMSRWFAFEGISSASELQDVFDCYDTVEQGEYPKNSGQCFTEFFLPFAYRAGWRLGDAAGTCWQLFEATAQSRLKKAAYGKLNVGMDWIAAVAQHVLTQFSDEDRPDFSIGKDQWQKAIRSTDFAQTLGLTYTPETPQ